MKYLKSKEIFESKDNQFFKTKEEIKDWLKSINTENVIINDDLTVSASFIDMSKRNLDFIPIQFLKVRTFDCSDNNLTSLKGSPFTCDYFTCANNNLKTLKFCPIGKIHTFNCCFNNLFNLNYLPKFHSLYIDSNPIQSLLKLIHYKFQKEFLEYLIEYNAIVENKIFLEKIKEILYILDIDLDLNELKNLSNYIILD